MDEKEAWDAIADSLDKWEGVVYPQWSAEIPPILRKLWVTAWRRGEESMASFRTIGRHSEGRPRELNEG